LPSLEQRISGIEQCHYKASWKIPELNVDERKAGLLSFLLLWGSEGKASCREEDEG
jgi:hypothetical protein